MSLLYKHCSGPPCVTVNQVTPLHDQLLHVNSTLRFAIKYSSNLFCYVSNFHSPSPSLVPCASGKQLFKCAPPKATTAHVQNHSSKICIMHISTSYAMALTVPPGSAGACGEPHLARFQEYSLMLRPNHLRVWTQDCCLICGGRKQPL